MAQHEAVAALETKLNDFDSDVRASALNDLASLIRSGEISVPSPREEVNLHYHTFYSFNANNWSPARIAWESLKYGLEVSGIVDFDVLDGMDEFLAAGELLGLKTVAGMESRVFIRELADKVTSSPNEPGVSYFMAAGCFKRPPAGSDAEAILLSMAATARTRNLALMSRVNDYLDPVALDYEADVTPLTPAGNATERHLLTAYDQKAREIFDGDIEELSEFWAEKLGMTTTEAAEMIPDTPRFHEKLRAKLMKYGGVGYVTPDSGSFPSIEDAVQMILGMDAIPMIAWLDGTNDGEEDAHAFLELLRSKGVVALNIIPDRNWNIKNADEKSLKVRKLDEIVKVCRAFNMPISVGTEMNKAGLPFVDDFSSPELSPYLDDFMSGARCLYGHTVLARYADFGYLSEGALAVFGDDIAARNVFFAEIGGRVYSREDLSPLGDIRGCADPAAIRRILG